ncbi:MAG TPA: hypothetical protein VNN18_07940 [Candidatus Xenobia bacterium]|nr:hypothetical protein [Candidatus Xenobia bacterium]
MSSGLKRVTAALIWLPAVLAPQIYASDHSDAPQAAGLVRQDANLSDLHAFVVGPNLVLSLCSNVAIPLSATSYVFPTDVTFEINLDVDSAVSPADPFGDGGTILNPERISEDIVFRIRFRADGSAQVQRIVKGTVQGDPHLVSFFAGLRDDPFIRGLRQGRNIAAVVLEVPLSAVLSGQSTILIWATSKVEDFDGPFQDLVGRSLRSMFPENDALNKMHPRQHLRRAGARPDVMIYNTALPAAFPNGRALTDDVIDLVGDPRTLANDAPFPSTNDIPFLTTFPYLAPPHPAP